MLIDVHRIRREGVPFEIDTELELPEFVGDDGEALLVGRARFVGAASPADAGVDLEGRIVARVGLACSRCLERLEVDVSPRFHLRLVSEIPDHSAGEIEIHSEDTELFHAAEGKAALSEIVTEQMWLGMPLKPVCGAGCGGLCPTCGANRNRIECECSREAVDPRLAQLLEFKKQGKDGD